MLGGRRVPVCSLPRGSPGLSLREPRTPVAFTVVPRPHAGSDPSHSWDSFLITKSVSLTWLPGHSSLLQKWLVFLDFTSKLLFLYLHLGMIFNFYDPIISRLS